MAARFALAEVHLQEDTLSTRVTQTGQNSNGIRKTISLTVRKVMTFGGPKKISLPKNNQF